MSNDNDNTIVRKGDKWKRNGLMLIIKRVLDGAVFFYETDPNNPSVMLVSEFLVGAELMSSADDTMLKVEVGTKWQLKQRFTQEVFKVEGVSANGIYIDKPVDGYYFFGRKQFLDRFEPASGSVLIAEVDDTFNDDTPAQNFGELMTCTGCQADYAVYCEQQRYQGANGGICFFCHHQEDNKMRLIGIAGQARSGKDTLASYLLDNLDDDWSRSSFADPMKTMLNAIDVDTSDEAKDLPLNQYGLSTRHMLQTLGTEWGRDCNGNSFWVDVFSRRNAGQRVIVPDVRFENEAELVRQHGVLIHMVGRGGIAGNHVSENPIGFNEGDVVIDNSRDLGWLKAQVDGNLVLSSFIEETTE